MKDIDNIDLAIFALLILGLGMLAVTGFGGKMPKDIGMIITGISGLATGIGVGKTLK